MWSCGRTNTWSRNICIISPITYFGFQYAWRSCYTNPRACCCIIHKYILVNFHRYVIDHRMQHSSPFRLSKHCLNISPCSCGWRGGWNTAYLLTKVTFTFTFFGTARLAGAGPRMGAHPVLQYSGMDLLSCILVKQISYPSVRTTEPLQPLFPDVHLKTYGRRQNCIFYF